MRFISRANNINMENELIAWWWLNNCYWLKIVDPAGMVLNKWSKKIPNVMLNTHRFRFIMIKKWHWLHEITNSNKILITFLIWWKNRKNELPKQIISKYSQITFKWNKPNANDYLITHLCDRKCLFLRKKNIFWWMCFVFFYRNYIAFYI